MNCCLFLPFMLGISLQWPCLTATENSRTEEVKHPVGSRRVKRFWVWNQIFVEEEMRTPKHRIGQLKSDRNDGRPSLRYKISGEGAGTIFSVDGKSGLLYVLQKLDREDRASYTLKAHMIDISTGETVEPESEFIIRVTDINDNEPKFLDGPYEAVVPEMSPEGTFVTQVTASDVDDPSHYNNGRLVYSLLQGQPYFSIEPTTGVIRTSAKMDRELQDEYWVVVQAKDKIGLSGALSGTASVLIKLTDVNDHKPIFTKSLYRMYVSELAHTGTPIGTIMAEDKDIGDNAEMHYSIEDASETFDIITDHETQEGIVILKKKVDFENQIYYHIKAKVKNRHVDEQLMKYHGEASTTSIKVHVEDEDEPPVFLRPQYTFDVIEGDPQGLYVGLVAAVDPDQRKSPVRYSVTRSKMFQIDDNGTIVTTSPLDREVSPWYNLSITAREIYNVEQISEVPVYVHVLNINDHAPEFSEYYDTYICEDAGSDQVIQTISAVDRDDSIEDHYFYYSLSMEDKNNSSFTIRNKTGNTAEILTNRSGFSLQEEPVFYISILIADNGIPPLTSTNTLTIRVCDCEDSNSTQACSSKYSMPCVECRAWIISGSLICIVIIFGFVFLIIALKHRRHQNRFPEQGTDYRDNIFRFDEEGAGEEDMEALAIGELRSRPVLREHRTPRTSSADIRKLCRLSLQAGPDDATLKEFILEKLEEADTDPYVPPFDSLQTYAFEGTGSLAGSLSSLESADSDQNEIDHCFNDWDLALKD
ncbi:cadherin-19 [Molossus nigricans]